MNQSANPLRQYFRRPAIYLRLPSGGEFWPDGSLDMPQNGELPVFPMTAIDEITYRTPDALFSGQAVVDVIQSCIPCIMNAWHMPVVDINAILVAIRIASYGNELGMTSTCPACSEATDFSLNLNSVLDRMRRPDYAAAVAQGDLQVRFQSMDYQTQNRSNIQQFENQRMMRIIPDSDLSEEDKIQQMNQILRNITQLTITALTGSIQAIETPSGVVTDRAHIQEFLAQCDRGVFASIRDHAVSLREQTELQPVSLKCDKCEHQYEQPLNLDLASFFAPAS